MPANAFITNTPTRTLKKRRAPLEQFLRTIGIDPAQSTSRNPLERSDGRSTSHSRSDGQSTRHDHARWSNAPAGTLHRLPFLEPGYLEAQDR